ncbi:putative calcium-dependent channel, 7TM region phosphate [Heracleum sosnowskyi]|uniref:Calcium-dependent channel, 7TM region phosphate n=1 Tax=Heracleum sosnowskyi TaxID=360622 RepID=A0AAD8H213_9APIA|nr:putative calcium-dependent channel, 7TM region phosphate [Heracleum sosnowskyi]
MILSALLTTVGINFALCLLFFTLYSVLRKQSVNAHVYAPRLVAEGKSPRSDFNLERFLPSASWVRKAWETSEDELLALSGLDGVVFMRIFIFSIKVFSFAMIIGFILLPINFLGNQLTMDYSDLPNKSLESFSISNVNDGSNRLWIHFSAAYIFTGFVCYLLYSELKYISSKRITCFHSSEPKIHQFTVLVRGIPVSSGISFSESVDNFFTLYYPSTYLSHVIVRRTSKLQKLISDADDLSKRLLHMKSTKYTGRKVDHLDRYEKKLETLVENVRMEQSLITGQEVPAAFVSFKSRFGAAIALHIKQGINPTEWNTEEAPEPQDVYWPFFSASFTKIWISKYVAIVACIVFTVLFFGPVLLVQSLTHLDQLETWFPFLKGILSMTFVSQVITGYLPSLILQLFQHYVPPTMILLSSIQGYIGHTHIEKSACYKILWFTIWTVFFANVLSGSILYQANVFLELKNIPSVLAIAVPGQAEFFIAYVVTTGWTSTSSELFQMINLIWNFFRRKILGREDDQLAVPSANYYSKIPKILLFGLLGITYLFLAPLILPFLLVYFCLGYIVFRNQLLTVYSPKHETNGKFWPIVHNSTICSLVLMHIIAIGIFGLKKIPLASGLMIPLPVMTLLFNNYCQRRFIPLFKSYPAECLIKKDRDDQSIMGATLPFFRQLKFEFEDPCALGDDLL